MPRGSICIRTALALGLTVMLASAASAQVASKLDPTARIALARLQSGETPQAIREQGLQSVTDQGEIDVFIVGAVTKAELEAAGARVRTALPGVFTAFIPVDKVEAVAAIAGVSRIEGAQIDEVTNDLGTNSTGAPLYRGAGPTFTGINGTGVIVANVDTGVDYDHEDFKNALGQTRILKFWDQTAVGPGPAGSGFTYGIEWNSAQIDALIATCGDSHGHGSHTMGSAAGDGSKVGTAGSAPAYTYTGMAPMADLIVVDGSTTGSFNRTQMLDAVNYVFQQATLYGKPAVVNMSIGSQFGPKDGTDAFELGIDALSGPGRVVVMSAGNDRNLNIHMERFAGDPPGTMSLTGTNAVARFTALNGYYEASEQLTVTITTPGGAVVGPVPVGGISGAYPGPLTVNGNVYIENGAFLTSTGDKQVYIELNSPAAGPSMAGTWTFTFTPVVIGPANCEVDLFRFANNMTTANVVVGNQPSEEIISGIATSPNSISVGAWVTRQNWTDCRAPLWNSPTNVSFSGSVPIGNIANFSSPGPTRDNRIKPDIAAPGTAIISVRSTDTAPSACTAATTVVPGQAHTVNQGTSMAAPHVTGACALFFQKYGANLTPTDLQNLIHSRAIVDGFVTGFGAAPNKDFGWGKLNLGDLADPNVTVNAPNGGEVFVIGSPITYQWAASDNQTVTNVDLFLSRDGGTNYSLIASGVPNTGSYGSTATAPPSNNCLLKVVATDGSTNVGADVSDLPWAIIDGPTPTLMSMMAADPLAEGISLRWQFGTGASFADVVVERSTEVAGVYATIDARATVENGISSLVDRSVESGKTYWYRIVGVTGTGSRTVFGPISATAGLRITKLALSRITPNPTTAAARVDFALPTAGHVRVSIHDVQGRELTRLVDGDFEAGAWQAMWNGRSDGGDAPAGLYFVRLQAMGQVLTQRLTLTR